MSCHILGLMGFGDWPAKRNLMVWFTRAALTCWLMPLWVWAVRSPICQVILNRMAAAYLAAESLTGKPYSAKLALTTERLHELRAKHGQELENWWIKRFVHTFDALTESEARYLARTETADIVRDRIAAAE